MGGNIKVVIKPVNWRQIAFSGFLFMTAFFFSVVGYIGVFFSWLGTIGFAVFGLLNLLDFFFEWSRLLINKDGYNLRGGGEDNISGMKKLKVSRVRITGVVFC